MLRHPKLKNGLWLRGIYYPGWLIEKVLVESSSKVSVLEVPEVVIQTVEEHPEHLRSSGCIGVNTGSSDSESDRKNGVVEVSPVEISD